VFGERYGALSDRLGSLPPSPARELLATLDARYVDPEFRADVIGTFLASLLEVRTRYFLKRFLVVLI
jgi:hypothetical protein